MIASAASSITGESTSSSSAAPTRSKVRLSAKSTPSKTGGLSSNSGSAWPGTNSTRSIRISIVDGATRTRTPCWWQRSTSSTASSCGEVGVGDQDLVDRVEVALELLERAEVAQPVGSARGVRATKP